jgi:acetylornithine/succinyldiaminopimelate/putrescine aminotransferase
MARKASTRGHLGRDREPPELVVAGARGSHVRGGDGRAYIDFTMGWCVGNLGWHHPAIVRRLRAWRGPSYVSPEHHYAPWEDLAGRLVALAPRSLRRAFRATGGTEAVEFALQLAMSATGRRRFVSLEGAYHGDSIATHSIGGHAKDLRNALPHCDTLKPPLDARALERLERKLAKGDVAAFIMEPVPLNLAVRIPDTAFMRGLRATCHRHGTLLIADEVATGFGRTGTLFACEHWNLQPDLMCLAKAMSGGHAGIGATLATEGIAKTAPRHSFWSTYGWHPLAVEAALAVVEVWETDGPALLEGVADTAAYFRERLEAMPFDEEPEIRMAGLAIALEFESADYAETLVERCRKRGLLVGDDGDGVLTMFPALNVPRATAREGLDILEACAGR